MANVIKHKRGSGSDPSASDLVVGEVAIRTDTGKLFTKMDNGSVAEIAGGGSDIAINTLSASSGTGGGSATFNGSAYRFTLSSPPSVSAQQLLVSINGVIQKPVAGTGQPSEGFSVDGNDIILGDAPATGADFFIITFKSLGVSEPADNSVTSAKIVDGTIVTADLADDAVTTAKIADGNIVASSIASDAITTAKIANLQVTDVKLADNAVALSKIVDGVITNAKINASAAIAGTKIAPNFGSQNISTTGNVGIGTTSPDGKLDVRGTIFVNGDGTGGRIFASSGNLSLSDGNGRQVLRIDDPGAGNSHAHIFDSNGRLGIGTTSPTTRFTIVQSANDSTGGLSIFDSTANSSFRIFRTGAGAGSVVSLQDRGTDVINIKDQQIGIGTTSPGSLLTLNHATNPAIQFQDSGTKVASINAEGSQTNIASFEGKALVFATSTSSSFSERMRIDTSGNIRLPFADNSTGLRQKIQFVTEANFFDEVGYIAMDRTAVSSAPSDMVFATGTAGSVSTRMRIASDGKIDLNASVAKFGNSHSTGTSYLYGNDIRFTNEDITSTRMVINSSGKILINRTNEDGTGVMHIAVNSGGGISVRTGVQTSQTMLDFGNQNGVVGSIKTSGTSTSFNTSSDHRLKENAVAISDGITRLKTLKPYRFNFKTDASTTLDGFFAHEVTAVPEAISGTKDAVDEDNNPIYQGIDQSKLVPLLVAALQEAVVRIEALEAS